jgi:hypothetical protein
MSSDALRIVDLPSVDAEYRFGKPITEPITVHLRGQNSDAQLAVVEMVIAAGNGGPPLHVHPTHAEGFYVLDGELVVQVGDEITMALEWLREKFAISYIMVGDQLMDALAPVVSELAGK